MSKTEKKTHKELFEGLCKVLDENSQPLSEEQKTALYGFIDVLVESVNKNWGSTVKEFLEQQKISIETSHKLELEKRDAAWRTKVGSLVKKIRESGDFKDEPKKTDLECVMEMLTSIKDEIEGKKATETEALKKQLEEFKGESVKATAAAIKTEKEKVATLKQECDKVKAECDAKDGKILQAENRIAQLQEELKAEKLKNYLESRISGLPTFEATLMRKRFSGAKSQEDIDMDFDRALSSVRERRNVASTTPSIRSGIVEVQPSRQLSETAKITKKVDLLTESNQAIIASNGDADDFTYIDSDETIPESDVAMWVSALG